MPNPNYIFANTINGNPLYADRAEHDADGNLISTTYATKAELPEGVPTVTSSDDGKVLTADYTGGVASYSWETPSGGGSDVYWAEMGVTSFSDIWTAVVAGKTVYMCGSGERPVDPSEGACNYFKLENIIKSYWGGANSYAIFSRTTTNGNSVLTDIYKLFGNDTHTSYSFEGTYVPSSDSTDENKVLTVNSSGTPVWASPSGIASITYGTSTYDDVINAYLNSNSVVICAKTNSSETLIGTFSKQYFRSNLGYVDFVCIEPVPMAEGSYAHDSLTVRTWTIAGNDTWSETTMDIVSSV